MGIDKSNETSLVRALHTAVKGRARYKVNGLYRSEALKRYLELRLSAEEGITQVRANYFTGNILVITHSDFSLNALALLLQDVVLDYRKQNSKLSVVTNYNSTALAAAKTFPLNKRKQKQLAQGGSQLILGLGTACTLVLCTGLLHRYSLDKGILLAIQKLHTPLRDRIMLGITFLGEPLVLLLICLGLEIGLLYYRRRWEANTLGITAVGAIGLTYLLKMLFSRARPALWTWIVDVGHYSFPSGHAMMSTAIYGFTSYILAKQFPQWRGQIFALTVVSIVAIGFSRLYLGVHWPTDVAAGYATGLVWLIACIVSLELWQKYCLSGRHPQEPTYSYS